MLWCRLCRSTTGLVIKQFAHAFVLQMEKDQPGLYLTKMSKAARKDRIFLDYLRNERGATAVAAFSPRARAGAPVSLPLSWSDLQLEERPVVHVADFAEWKGRLQPRSVEDIFHARQSISPKLLELSRYGQQSKLYGAELFGSGQFFSISGRSGLGGARKWLKMDG